MPELPTGTPAPEGQAQPGNPQPAPGQPQGQEPPPTPKPGEPPKQDTPPIAELQQRLAQAEEAAKKAAESAKYFQGNYDRAQQQLRALAGAEPKPDPNAEDINYWVQQGYDPKDAKAMVEFFNRKLQPVVQQNQTLRATVQATSQINDIMSEVMQDRDYAGAFSDPAVAQEVYQGLQFAAQNGQLDYMNANYARTLAAQAYGMRKPWNGQQQQQFQPQPPQPRPHYAPAFSLVGQPGGYQPAPVQQQQRQTDPAVEALAARMAQHTGIPLQPKQ